MRVNGHVGDLDLRGETGAIWITGMRDGRLTLPDLFDPAAQFLLRLDNCRGVECDLPTITGEPNPIGWQFGVRVDDCIDVTLTGGDLSDLRTGIAVATSARVTIAGARIARIADGVSLADGTDYTLDGVTVAGSVSDYVQGGARAHPDLVQMQARNAPLERVTIRGCMLRAWGGPSQGIFSRDHGPGLSDVHVIDTVVGASLAHGISLGQAARSRVVGCTLFPEPGVDSERWPVLLAAADAEVTGNTIWRKRGGPLVRGGADGEADNTEMTAQQLDAWHMPDPPVPPIPEPEPDPLDVLRADIEDLRRGQRDANVLLADLRGRLAQLTDWLRSAP